jgi:phosphoglycolate phosphatase
MRFRGAVFDLDGTLLDSLADIAAAANRALELLGYPTHREADFAQFVGEGAQMLFRRCLPEAVGVDPGSVAKAVATFKSTYEEEWNQRSRPYEGIDRLLDGLVARGVALAVLSNKPDAFTQKCVSHYFGKWEFRAVHGEREGVPRKPDPTGAILIARELGIRPDGFLYIGDTATDITTACGAGMRAVGVSWGFRPVSELEEAGAEIVVDQPGEILGLIDGTTSIPHAAGTGYDTDPGV